MYLLIQEILSCNISTELKPNSWLSKLHSPNFDIINDYVDICEFFQKLYEDEASKYFTIEKPYNRIY